MENNLASTVALLRRLSRPVVGLASLARDLRIGPSRLSQMLDLLAEEGLLETGVAGGGRAGRPRRWMRATPLGTEFLDAYEGLQRKRLKSRGSDLSKAAAAADYASRITGRGLSAYALFFEVNAIARRP